MELPPVSSTCTGIMKEVNFRMHVFLHLKPYANCETRILQGTGMLLSPALYCGSLLPGPEVSLLILETAFDVFRLSVAGTRGEYIGTMETFARPVAVSIVSHSFPEILEQVNRASWWYKSCRAWKQWG